MAKFAGFDFESENERKAMMDKYFTKTEWFQKTTIYSNEITKSPVVREMYFKDKFREIPDFEKLVEELERQEQLGSEVGPLTQADTEQQPISQDCIGSVKKIAASRKLRDVKQTSQEIRTEYHEIEEPIQNQQQGREEG